MLRRQSLHHCTRTATPVLVASTLAFWLLALAPPALDLPTSASADEWVYACGAQTLSASIFDNTSSNEDNTNEEFGIQVTNDCLESGSYNLELENDGVNKVAPGTQSWLIAHLPPYLTIVSASVPIMDLVGTVGTGYVADMMWTGGEQRVDDSWKTYNISFQAPGVNAFGFNLACAGPSSCPADGAYIGMNQMVFDVQQTVAPVVIALGSNNLWYKGASEYVRGSGWSVAYSATAPSGIESMAASEDGTAITSPQPPGCDPITTVWQQCPSPQTWSPTVSLSGTGNQELVLGATSSTGNPGSPTETLQVDNIQPTISLSGPTQASGTAGTQYVTATAVVGPSGLGSISCSTDGEPDQSYSTSPARIPVLGLGMHSIRCIASNRAYNSAGQVAVSAPATWSLDIAQPTVSGVSFSKIIHALKCKKVKERVYVAARWVTVHRHGKLVKVHRRARTKVVKEVRCQPRIVKRKVTVLVKEKKHGRTVLVSRKKVERVVVLPRVVGRLAKRVAFGRGATVSGYLGMANGTALAGRTVKVLTAPNNGLAQWALAAVVTTNADGAWSATLPAGPSRLVEAAYGGDTTTEPSMSSAIHLIVPAKLKLRISPHRVAWGGTIHITGRVLGGYIPGGKLLRLRIGVAGVHETVGIPSIGRHGRFHTTWTFASGRGVVRYWFSVSTLNEADYAFAPGSSRRVYVRVGPG